MKNTKSRKLTRKEREFQAHRQEILEVAEQVFIQKGYHGATIEEIAREAEFATGTIYNYFDSKEELYNQVIQTIAQDFMDDFEEEVLSKDKPKDAIAALIDLRLSHFQKHRGFFRVFFETTPGSQINPERAIPKNCVKMYDSYLQQVTDIFNRGVEDGTFDRLNPLFLTLCLQGVVNAFVAYWSHRGSDEPSKADVEQLKNIFISRAQVKLLNDQEQTDADK
jgi:AcrR family transcriptional regulator